jgi:hypothetical protein
MSTVPYTLQWNDFQNFEDRRRAVSDFVGELNSEFDVLHHIARFALSSPQTVKEGELA